MYRCVLVLRPIGELPTASRYGNEVVATHARDKSVCADMGNLLGSLFCV